MTKTDVAPLERPLITIPARHGAVAWLNAALASSQEKNRPILYRTLSLEFFPFGVQLVGCDGTALIRAFVPSFEQATWPAEDEAPTRSLIASDADHFAAGFMRILVQVTADDAHASEPLTISVMPADDEAAPSLGMAFQRERLVLRACGQRLDLPIMEAQYPGWRQLDFGMPGERVRELRIGTRLFAMLGKLKATGWLDLRFLGEQKHIVFVGKGLVEVRGLVMPMRKVEAAVPAPDPLQGVLAEAVASLAPEEESGIMKFTASAGGRSFTLLPGGGDRIRRKARLPEKKPPKKKAKKKGGGR